MSRVSNSTSCGRRPTIVLASIPLLSALFGVTSCRSSSTLPSGSGGSAGSSGRAEIILPRASSTSSHRAFSPARSSDHSSAEVTVDSSKIIATVSRDEIGMNLAVFYDVTQRDLPAEVASVHPRILRWPGGSSSDTYHWKRQTECNPSNNQLITAYDPRSTFDNFMHDIVIPGHYDVAITVNYGSNETCTGGGDSKEAAAWVAYAKREGYDRHIKYWTVGNEEYGNWEYDLHSNPHDPMTYAEAVSGPDGFYALMKAADPAAKIGVVVTGAGSAYHDWDNIVLTHAPYDFVELHDYLQQPGQESDSYLLHQAPEALGSTILRLRDELAAAGRPRTPIMLGEFNSVTYSPGKQTVSIVNGLFTGLAFGQVLNHGLAVATWWFGAGGEQGCHHNNSRALYGWQNFGGYDLVAAHTRWNWNGCGDGIVVPEGALFPSGDAFSMVSRFAQPGAKMLAVSVSASLPDVHAYADKLGVGNYAIMLFNLNERQSARVTVSVSGSRRTSFLASTITYDKRLYDLSRNNVWARPQSANLGKVGATPTLTLSPWSITLLKLQ